MPLRVQQSVYMTDEKCPAVCIHDYELCPAVCIHDWWTVSSSLYTWLMNCLQQSVYMTDELCPAVCIHDWWTASSSLYTRLMNCVPQSVYMTDELCPAVCIHNWWTRPDCVAKMENTSQANFFCSTLVKWATMAAARGAQICCCCWLLLYSTILCSRADSLHSHVILLEWPTFSSAFFNLHQSGVLTALEWLVPHETAVVSVRSVYTIHPCTMSLHAKPHICKVHECLRFGQNDQDLLGAIAATWGWNGYQSKTKSQHRKLTLQELVTMTF